MKTYIATAKSKQIIKQAKRAEKNGEVIDWQQVLDDSWNHRAITKEQQLKTAGGKRG